jgi:predicted permease
MMGRFDDEIRNAIVDLNLRPERENEIVQELAQHLEDKYHELRETGVEPGTARLAALEELNSNDILVRELRRVERITRLEPVVPGRGRVNMIGDVGQDLRYGLRMLRRGPGFTAVAVLSLALGIGANTAIFTLVNAVLLAQLPVRDPGQLVLFSDTPGEGTSISDGLPIRGEWELFSFPLYEYLRDHQDSFDRLCAFRSGESLVSLRVEGSGEAAQLSQVHLVSGNFFELLGVQPILGRSLTSEDDQPGAPPAAVISYACWRDRFNRAPDVVGRQIVLNSTPFTIVGVSPREFFGERVRRPADMWLPLTFHPDIELRESYLTNPNAYWLNMMGRLRPGVETRQAQASINVLLHQYVTERYGSSPNEDTREAILQISIGLKPGGGGLSGLRYFYSEPLRMLMVIVGVVLMIACANVGNLLLSRSAARQMEISLRLALGASRVRLIRQLLTESFLLAILGGIAGLFIAGWLARGLVSMVARSSPLDVGINWLILGFTAGVSLVSGIVFGLAPAIRATRSDLSAGLKDRAARGSVGRRGFGLGSSLVIAQVGLSLVLVIGAGLFGRSLIKLHQEDLGFDRDNLLLIRLDPRLAGYKPTALGALYEQLLDRVNALPGVTAATMASYGPLSGSSTTSNISLFGRAQQPGQDMVVKHLLVGPNYCEALGLPLLMGREIGRQDTPASAHVAMVNEAFAKYFCPDENPIGRRFGFGDEEKDSQDIEIVGVVGDARFAGVQEDPTRMAFMPILQVQNQFAYMSDLEIRTEGDPLAMASTVRSAIAQVDDKVPIVNTLSLSGQLEASLRQERLIATLVSLFGLLAMILASIGLYGLMAHRVARRTNEIGIRMALGAERRSIVWMVMRETMTLVAIGICVGIPASVGAGRLISNQLFGLSPTDPLTIATAAILLTIVAVFAGYLPARRASRVDPIVALRYE